MTHGYGRTLRTTERFVYCNLDSWIVAGCRGGKPFLKKSNIRIARIQRFETAAITISGIELAAKIRKGCSSSKCTNILSL